jgi:hypothetical protein
MDECTDGCSVTPLNLHATTTVSDSPLPSKAWLLLSHALSTLACHHCSSQAVSVSANPVLGLHKGMQASCPLPLDHDSHGPSQKRSVEGPRVPPSLLPPSPGCPCPPCPCLRV